jgi:formate hydrogenlyase subunit 4
MSAAWELPLRLAGWLLLAPLLPGLINKVKAWVAGRRGPPVLQLYYDLAKLWRKGVVLSTAASPGHLAGPAVAWIAVVGGALLLPLGSAASGLAFRGDVLLFVYLLALARFCTAWAALETGSAFEGMGAAREVSYAVLSEAALITGLLALSVQTGNVSLSEMLEPTAGPGAALLAAGLFAVLLAENCRVPFDDPNTHLELTMVHEVMVLDHSGPPLAVILHAASVKLLVFAVLLAQAVLPLGEFEGLAATGALVAVVLVIIVGVGLVESLVARLAFQRVPVLLTTAFLLCLFALLIARSRGGEGHGRSVPGTVSSSSPAEGGRAAPGAPGVVGGGSGPRGIGASRGSFRAAANQRSVLNRRGDYRRGFHADSGRNADCTFGRQRPEVRDASWKPSLAPRPCAVTMNRAGWKPAPPGSWRGGTA